MFNQFKCRVVAIIIKIYFGCGRVREREREKEKTEH